MFKATMFTTILSHPNISVIRQCDISPYFVLHITTPAFSNIVYMDIRQKLPDDNFGKEHSAKCLYHNMTEIICKSFYAPDHDYNSRTVYDIQ